MHVACLFSGGKDSVLSSFWAINQGWDVTLVCVKSEEYSMMFHHPNVDKTKLQARELGLKIEYVKSTKEKELEDLKKRLKKLKVQGIVSGALRSEYQRERLERIGGELGIPTFAPLWHKEQVIEEEVKKYFETYIVAVSAEGLNEGHLGMEFKKIPKLPGVHPMFEGGEAETFVANTPFFKNRIKIKGWKKKWDGVRGVAELIV